MLLMCAAYSMLSRAPAKSLGRPVCSRGAVAVVASRGAALALADELC